DAHEVAHRHGAVLRNPSHVVASQIDKHHMLGALLLVGEKICRHPLVFFRGASTWTRPRDRAYGYLAIRKPHQQLGRAADELRTVEVEMVHVRRWIQGAQCTVEMRAVEVVLDVDATREQALKAIAGANVFLDALDVSDESVVLVVRFADQRPGRRAERERLERRGIEQASGDRVELRLCIIVQLPQLVFTRFARNGHGHDEPSLRPQVVDHHEAAREDEQRVWYVELLTRWMRERFDRAYDVVSEVADCASPEHAELRHVCRRVLLYQPLQISQGVGDLAFRVPATGWRPVRDDPIRQRPRRARLGAHEGVAGPRFAARRSRLQKEGEAAPPELCEGGNGGIYVQQHVAPDGDEPGCRCMRAETVEIHALS